MSLTRPREKFVPSIEKQTERAKKYDNSNHSTHRREKGDLNAPGQGDERGGNDA
jgi:hypothetical protein